MSMIFNAFCTLVGCYMHVAAIKV